VISYFLKGDRCLSPKCAVLRRANTPGTSGAAKVGQNRKRKKSEYGIQLQEKQKAKRGYGMREKQFSLVYQKSSSDGRSNR
jgi:small subunit ribosomal protein S4